MAINFNKLFLQNLLPKAQSTTHAQVSGFSSSEAIFEGSGSQDYPEAKDMDVSTYDEQQDNETEKLTQILESLRMLIDKHRGRRPGLRDAERLQLRAPVYTQAEPHVTEQARHRKSTMGHQPYQVDSAPICKEVAHSKTNERMSKKSEKVSNLKFIKL